MKYKNNNNDDNYLITFSDFKLIVKQSKYKVLFFMWLFALIGGAFAMLRAPHYYAQASFREKAKSASDSGKPISLALLAGASDSNENSAISLMKSRKLLEKVIQKRNMQASIEKAGTSSILKRLRYFRDNLIVEYALLRDYLTPVISDYEEPVKAIDLVYAEEVPVDLKINFETEDKYQIRFKNGAAIGSGTLGEPFRGPDFKLTLVNPNGNSLAGQVYDLEIKPLYYIAEKVAKKLTCESDSRDKGLLKLSYRETNRHDAVDFVNALMAEYVAHLRGEHQQITSEQITYLNKRQDEASIKLKEMMEEHASALSSNMATIDFLFQQQQHYTQKLLSIDLELRRLQKSRNEGLVFYERYWIDGSDPAVIGQFINDIRSYRQQSDSIEIALRNVQPEGPEKLKQSFLSQMYELDELRCCADEAKAIFKALQNNQPIPPIDNLVTNPKYMINEWLDRVEQEAISNENKEPGAIRKDYSESYKTSFNSYLTNLIHLLEVEEKLILERLAHQQAPQLEFQGIDLATSNQLYMAYSKTLNDIEGEILHHTFLIDQLKEPAFEPSSLSSVLVDPVSVGIINKAGNLVLMVKDADNRSNRELDRLKNELAQQKGFLSLHLQQTTQLLNLRKKLYQDKILALQNAQLELIQQKISVLEKHLLDYVDNRISNLKQERTSIQQQQLALKKEMEKMPSKWASEKLIDQHLEMSKKMIEEITKLVESKNISSNLDISQSAPMDRAIPPIHPIRSKVLLFALLGGIFGALVSMFSILSRSILRGVPATQDNLSLFGQNVVGVLSRSYKTPSEPLLDSDLDTLRRLSTHLCSATDVMNHGQSLLLMVSSGVDYSRNLALLLSKSGFKVLLMPITFEEDGNPELFPGLMQYIEGKAALPKITHADGYDCISPGGITRFSNELIGSRRFQDLLSNLQQQYDWVISVSKTSPTSGEGENLIHLFNHAAITITDEKLRDLKNYLSIVQDRQSGKRISFIFTADKDRPSHRNY